MSTVFDPLAVALDGQTVVEASAGTGKTYTLTQLYLRLLLEQDRAPSDILVVTYTIAATADLRRKLRQRIVDAAAMLRGDVPPDDFVAGLRVDSAQALRVLDRALATFDEAAIHTIHGFCQRVLADHAFESGAPFDGEVLPDERHLVQEVIDDHWRRVVETASSAWAEYLLERREGPDALARALGPFLGRRDLEIHAAEDPGPTERLEAAHAAAWTAARDAWIGAADTIEALLLAAPLKRNLYKETSIPGWCAQLSGYFAATAPRVAAAKPLAKFRADALAPGAGTRKDGVAPRHPFFDAAQALDDAGQALRAAYAARALALRRALLEAAPGELARRKAERGLLSYDDLLHRVQEALAGPAGPALAATLRRRWKAALVDEFQDTDPVQYDILRRVWGGEGLPLVLVGDPKQAIYAFRGADLFAYLRARDEAGTVWPLDRNWRSDPGLLAAVNALFQHAPRPFLLDAVEFRPAFAAERAVRATLETAGPAAPLTVWFMPRVEGARIVRKPDARARAARATAAAIAHLLRDAAAGRARRDGRPLTGGDLAVLVRTHREGSLMREELLALGIPSVQQAQDSVFAMRESRELELVLLAIAEPGAEGLVRAALATEMLGRSAEDLDALAADEIAWSDLLLRVQGWRQLWREQGFVQMFRRLLADEDVAPRLLAYADGERRLTNLLHLGELLQDAAARLPGGPDALLAWMAERRADGMLESEEQQLRLESDEHLVRIVTIHKSKGLEYPIVFCPFVWDGRLFNLRASELVFHDADGRCHLDLGSAASTVARGRACEEELAEQLRLLYVALTRAQHRCVIVWGGTGDAGTSALSWLLRGPSPADDATMQARGNAFRGRSDDALRADLATLAAAADGAIGVVDLTEAPGERLRVAGTAATPLAAARLRRQPPAPWSIASFTSLAAGRPDEGPDHDAADPAGDPRVPADALVVAPPPPHVFPPGARAGRCLHAVLEHLVPELPPGAARRALVARHVRAHGFGPEWEPAVLAMAERALDTALDPAGRIRMRDVPQRDRLAELEFTYRLGRLDGDGLRGLLRTHPLADGAFAAAVDAMSFDAVQGFLRGYVDLLFRADGRWWLLDWKSNWLGPAPEDYAAERLVAVMARDAYWLQYLVYAVVAHRFLHRRVPGFDWDRDFGGVFYVFLRGLDPAQGGAHGVFHDRPPAALVSALDAWMGAAVGTA